MPRRAVALLAGLGGAARLAWTQPTLPDTVRTSTHSPASTSGKTGSSTGSTATTELSVLGSERRFTRVPFT